MATTITIVQVNVPSIPLPGQPPATVENVDIYVYDSVTTNLWIWNVPDIPVGTALATIQTQLDANAAALLAAVQGDVPIATGSASITKQWIASHHTWKKTFAAAKMALETSFLGGGTLDDAAYRTALQAALTVLAILPMPFQNEFAKERTARSASAAPITGAVSSFSRASCQLFHDFLRAWLLDRACEAIIADHADEWINGG